MAESQYPGDIQFAGLVQAATAAADEQTHASALGKRKRDEDQQDIHNTDYLEDAPDPTLQSQSPQPHTPQLQNSASVLFREVSAKSKKYSRPPLGKVYASLELAPENFLRLQSAAKAFMLDDAHPERRDVVGHKKNMGGADVAKLNLWNCVEEFLMMHGYGEKYFAPGVGEGIPGAPVRSLEWPRDREQIIKLMMPLMRKMVTNERQRVYAANTRRSGANKLEGGEHSPIEGNAAIMSEAEAPEGDESTARIDPSLTQPIHTTAEGDTPDGTIFKQSVKLYVNVVSNNGGALRRVIPRLKLEPEQAPSLAALITEVAKRYKHPSLSEAALKEKTPVVKVWLTDGLVTVAEDGEWMVALLSAGVVDWMDGEVRVLVEV